MEVISNEYLKIKINLIGGTLDSIYDLKNNQELEYEIEKDSWQIKDVLIFPFPGVNNFIYQNQEYHIPTRHGLIRTQEFKILTKKDNFIELYSLSNSETKKLYPFDYIFIISYSLIDKYQLEISSKIIPLNNNLLYGGFGSHLGIKANEENYIDLNNNNLLYPLINGLIDLANPIKLELKDNLLSLNKETFKKYDTFVFKNNTQKLFLNTINNRIIKYEFDSPYFAIWSNPNKGNYVCIEPWWGLSNYINEDKEIDKRIGINKIDSLKEFKINIDFNYSK